MNDLMNTGLDFENFEKGMKFAEFLSKSKLIPTQFQGKPEDILVAIMWGTSLGLREMQSLNAIAVINGRPSLFGDAPKALCMKYGKVIEEWDSQNSMWIVTCKRDGYPDVVQTFGYNDAIAAGFISYDPKSNTFGLGRRKSDAWLSNPKRMCQMRARSFALRDAFPDILNGINFEGDGYDEIPNPAVETVTEVTPDVQQITEQKNNELMQQLQQTENVAENMAGIRTGKMFKLDEEEKTGLLGGLVLLMFGIIISLLLAYAHKQSIEQNGTKPAKTVCIQVDQNGNITEVKKKED